MLTLSALIDAGKVTARTKMLVPGELVRQDRVIHDHWEHGLIKLTLAGVLAKSSNVGTVLAADRFEPGQLRSYLDKFGLGRPTNVGLGAESRGILPDPSIWTDQTEDRIAFGQSLSVNAVQMTAAVNTIANHGVRVDPTLIQGQAARDDGMEIGTDVSTTSRVVSAKAARQMTLMMERVVDPEDGVAPLANVPGYRVAGKTGTAQRVGQCKVGNTVQSCYNGTNTVSFAGFAPAENPRFTVYVVIQAPTNGLGGGANAGPVFSKLMGFTLQRYGVPPEQQEADRPARRVVGHTAPDGERRIDPAAAAAAHSRSATSPAGCASRRPTPTRPGTSTPWSPASRSARSAPFPATSTPRCPARRRTASPTPPDALAAGAVALLTDPAGAADAPAGVPLLVVAEPRRLLGRLAARVYGEPATAMRMVGVTGTQGKTTTTRLAEGGLERAGVRAGVIGTVGTRIAGEEVKTSLTTPEAPDLHALFALMRERDGRGVRDGGQQPRAGDGPRRRRGLRRRGLPQPRPRPPRLPRRRGGLLPRQGLALHPRARPAGAGRDRRRVRPAAGRRDHAPGAHLLHGGRRRGLDGERRASRARTARRSGCTAPASTSTPAVPLPGGFNVTNALAAIAACAEAGLDAAAVAAGIAAGGGVPGRFERIDAGQPFTVVVDYAHKPDAVEAALQSLRPLTDGRLLVVLGAGGDRDPGKRPIMGEIAARLADVVVVTDDNPRTEDPAAIRAAVLEGARAGGAEVLEEGDRRAAIAAALRLARPGDIVVVAGKGHETGQEVAGVVHPFDDREVVRELLSGYPTG